MARIRAGDRHQNVVGKALDAPIFFPTPGIVKQDSVSQRILDFRFWIAADRSPSSPFSFDFQVSIFELRILGKPSSIKIHPFETTNPLSFHQHHGFRKASGLFFRYITGCLQAVGNRPFVFINITGYPFILGPLFLVVSPRQSRESTYLVSIT